MFRRVSYIEKCYAKVKKRFLILIIDNDKKGDNVITGSDNVSQARNYLDKVVLLTRQLCGNS